MESWSLWGQELPASIALGSIAAGAYLLSHARYRFAQFTVLDALLIVAIMAIGTAVAMPILSRASDQAHSTALLQNLKTLRGQIELYKAEHGGQPPLLYDGAFPQLTGATNAKGVPGAPGKEYPLGPYLPSGIPQNPFTGVSVVTPTDTFPPTAASGTGGWLYHQETGRIVPDLEGHLSD